MADILDGYPAAKVALFQRYHIGGCTGCGYAQTDKLGDVLSTHNIQTTLQELQDCIDESAVAEAALHTNAQKVRAAIDSGKTIHLFDARSHAEWDRDRIEGARLLTPDLTFEILDALPADAPIVVYSNRGNRSLERASHLRAYGKTNAKSLDGGLEAWHRPQEPTS